MSGKGKPAPGSTKKGTPGKDVSKGMNSPQKTSSSQKATGTGPKKDPKNPKKINDRVKEPKPEQKGDNTSEQEDMDTTEQEQETNPQNKTVTNSSQNDDCNASSDDENVNGESNTGGNKQGAYTNQGPCHQEPGAPGKGNKKCKHGHHNHERHHGAQQDEMSYHSNSERGQYMQALKQMQRSAEASKQMLYGVFGNVVTIVEEFERREHGDHEQLPQSKIYIPDQSGKDNEDIESIVETQLLLFETQSRVCPKEVSQSVNKELRRKTLEWAAVRAERKIPTGRTDFYICKLYEVLAKGKTRHEFLEKPREPVTQDTMKDVLPLIMRGKHEAGQLDADFKKDENKKATAPETRTSELDDAYEHGGNRIVEIRHDLKQDILEDIAEFKKEVPDSLK